MAQVIADLAASGNELLAALPPAERAHLLRDARTRRVEPGDVLYEPGRPLTTVSFPITAVVSLLAVLGDGSAVEVATIGREGLVGAFTFLGDDRDPNARAVVQMGGEILSVDLRWFDHELRDPSTQLNSLLNDYTRASLVQLTQSVACGAAHSVRERLARWLLQTSDRVASDEVELTHEFLAGILHTRRASVTVALRELQEAGIVATRRGAISILDRDALGGAACECYSVVREEYARLLPGESVAAAAASSGGGTVA